MTGVHEIGGTPFLCGPAYEPMPLGLADPHARMICLEPRRSCIAFPAASHGLWQWL